jgi:hypothetical protein
MQLNLLIKCDDFLGDVCMFSLLNVFKVCLLNIFFQTITTLYENIGTNIFLIGCLMHPHAHLLEMCIYPHWIIWLE